MANILTHPTNGAIYFDDGTAGSSTVPALTGDAVSLNYDGSAGLNITSYNTTSTDRFTIDGDSGRLFSVNDSLTGTIFSVNDAAGLPIIEVESTSTTDTITMGTYASNALVVAGDRVGIGTATPNSSYKLDVTGAIRASTNIHADGALSSTGNLETYGTVTISTIDNATTDLNKFLVSDSGLVKYRTGAEVLSDIGALSSETVTSLALTSGSLVYTDEGGTANSISLAAYLDEDSRSIASGSLNSTTGIVTFTRDDSTTFTLDLADLLDDTNLVTSVAGKSGVVSLVKGDVGLGNVTNESKATMFASPALTGNPTAPTQAANNNSTRIATTAYVQTEITDLIGGAPGALDTLNELAFAINDDASYAGTITTALATKLPKSGGTMTGGIVAGGGISGLTNSSGITGTNFNISGVNQLTINDPGEGILFTGTNNVHLLAIDDAADNIMNFSGAAELQVDGDAITTVPYIASRGQQLVTNYSGLLGDNTNFSQFTYDGTVSNSSPASFKYAGSATVFTDELMAVNANKKYRMSVDAKSLNGVGRYYMMTVATDVDDYIISAQHHMYRANTATTLAVALTAGDTTVTLAGNGSNYYNAGTAGSSTHLRSLIFWEYSNSLGYTYPVETYSRLWYGNAWDPGDVSGNVITLRVPWAGATYPIGSKLSNGSSGGSYKYNVMVNKLLTTDWTTSTGYMDGVDYSGTNITTKFPPATAKVKMGWLMNYQSGNTGTDTAWFTNLFVGVDAASNTSVDLKADIASPTFTGTPTAPTPTLSDNTTKLATTQYVKSQNYATAGDENIIDGATAIWNADGDGDVFVYDDSNPVHNGKTVGAVINIRGDGSADHSLVRAGLLTSNFVSTLNGYYVGTLLGTANSTTTQVINGAGVWTGTAITYASLSGTPTIPSGNQIIDWTQDQGSTNVHANNYTDTNTTYSIGDGGLTTNDFTNADHSKLNAIEANATADQTAAQILTAIKTVDGSGSGLDADLLDGQSSAYYGTASDVATNSAKTGITGAQASAITANTAKITNSTNASDLASGTVPNARLPSTFTNLVDGVTNLPYTFNLYVYGASNLYYPVHFAGGNQNTQRTIKIYRGYSEQGPNDWNTSTHRGSLNLVWKGNYGAWGGAVYTNTIEELTQQYSTLYSGNGGTVDNSYGKAFFLRGGGTGGAVYHIASDQPLDWTGTSYLTYTEPTAFYSQDLTFNHSNNAYDKYAAAGRSTIDTAGIANQTLVKGGDATQILTAIKTVDGSGSGLDADLLDGQSSAYYGTAAAVATNSAKTGITGAQASAITANTAKVSYNSTASTKLATIETSATADQTAAEILTAIKTVDGSGSGLDADTLDGYSSTSFASSTQGTTADNALPKAGGTMTGNLVVEDSEIHVGDTSGDNWTRIKHAQADGYGFDWQHNNASVIVNEQGGTNQALVLGDVDASTYSGLFGIAHSTNSGSSWTKKLDLQGNGELYIGSSGTSKVWHAGNDGAASGLDADLLDGQQGSYYGTASAVATNTSKTGITVAQASAISANTAKVTNSTNASDLASGTVAAARLSTAVTQIESDDSTKIATTAYVVDKITTLIGGAPSTLNDLNELAAAINDDASYNTTLTTALATKLPKSGGTMTGDLQLNDNVVLKLGTGSDFQMLHNGSSSSINNYLGNLFITQNANDADIIFRSDDGSGGLAEYLRLDGGIMSLVANKDLLMQNDGDGGKIKLGASQDLQIYHDGSNSYIDDTSGTGSLYVNTNAFRLVSANKGENMISAFEDGAVNVYHNNSRKLYTTSTGISVEGNTVVSGTVDGRDVATDGTKLDGIEANATADQTAAEILTAIKTVDGAGSGLDADTLDGYSSTAFAGAITAPNAPASVTTTIVGETIDVTFAASTTSSIDAYLVYSSIDGSDYGLISVIPPEDFSASMSVIDNAFTETGTQAYRVYAMKKGMLSSATTGSVSYTVSSADPTTMSVVDLNNAFYIQWNPPSTNGRFVSAYNVYKHEHATQNSLDRTSASLVYSGLNTNYMEQVSGTNNNNFHQFWVETTIA